MHNLAICMKDLGYQVSGSDDVIFDPSKSNLEAAGLLPPKIGFDADYIHKDLDMVILGMHAKKDNPELLKAKELNIPVVSFPEFIYEHAKDKKRIVIGGSHGKTSTTAMIMHVFQKQGIEFDYLVGSSLKGFPLSVKLSKAPIIVIEGDEYLSSPIDRRSKFLHYHPDVAVITGIAWDHVNVFPTFETYVNTFKQFIEQLKTTSHLIAYQHDEVLKELLQFNKGKTSLYEVLPHQIVDEQTSILEKNKVYPLQIFGKHNLENLAAAMHVCADFGISNHQFLESLADFTGTARRLEAIDNNKNWPVFKDFAHSPSKLKATISSVKEQFSTKRLIACMELHTFSSTDSQFLREYKDSMESADIAVIYMSSHAFSIKNKEMIDDETIRTQFNREDINIIREPEALGHFLEQNLNDDVVLLMMTSGNFDGFDIQKMVNSFSY